MLARPGELLCGFLGDRMTLDYYAGHLPALHPVELKERALSDDIGHRAELWDVAEDAQVLHVSAPPEKVTDVVEALGAADWVAEPAFGAIIVRSAVDEARAVAALDSLGASIPPSTLNEPMEYFPDTKGACCRCVEELERICHLSKTRPSEDTLYNFHEVGGPGLSWFM